MYFVFSVFVVEEMCLKFFFKFVLNGLYVLFMKMVNEKWLMKNICCSGLCYSCIVILF